MFWNPTGFKMFDLKIKTIYFFTFCSTFFRDDFDSADDEDEIDDLISEKGA